MPNVLTVDDSKAIRTLVTKQMQALGFDVAEAEDGEDGLVKLQEMKFDLVLLDVTMPILDGTGMLRRMREAGDQTPVIMLTSESKTSVIGEAMRLGIQDYILKPFKPEEMRDKVLKALKASAPGPESVAKAPALAPAAAASSAVVDVGGKPFVDVLSIDDMENVHKKLRALMPAHITVNSCANAHGAVQVCREKVFRCVLVDTTLPDIDSVALMHQLRILQPHASFVSLALRSSEKAEQEALTQGFNAALLKPFDPDSITDFLTRFFDNPDFVTTEDEVVRVAAYTGKEDRIGGYYEKVKSLALKALDDVAAACHEDVLLDLTNAAIRPDRSVRLLIDMEQKAKTLGLRLKIVGTPAAKKLFTGFTETAAIPFFGTANEAREAA